MVKVITSLHSLSYHLWAYVVAYDLLIDPHLFVYIDFWPHWPGTGANADAKNNDNYWSQMTRTEHYYSKHCNAVLLSVSIVVNTEVLLLYSIVFIFDHRVLGTSANADDKNDDS